MALLRTIPLLLVTCASACSGSQGAGSVGLGQPVLSSCASPAGPEFYFGSASSKSDLKELARYLALMHEPSLACDASWDEAYRLVSVPSLGLHRTVVRVTRTNDQVEVTAVVLARGPDDYDWKVASRKERHLTRQDVQRFEDAVRALDLWHRPMMPIGEPVTHLVLDGGSSFVEGRLERTHHMTFPALAGAGAEEFNAAAREFFSLAQINSNQLE